MKGAFFHIFAFFINALNGYNKKGDFMRKFIRILNGITAFAVAVIFGVIAYADAYYPNEFYVKNSSDLFIDNIFFIKVEDEQSVDYQSAQSVGKENSDLTILGVIPVKSETIKTPDENTVLVSGDSF